MTTLVPRAPARPLRETPSGLVEVLTSTDHKKIGLLVCGTALGLFFIEGVFALIMRTQLSRPDQTLINPALYDQLFTMHGSGMIYLVITPIAIGYGVYLVPLQVGSPVIAAPRLAAFGYWLYALAAVTMLSSFFAGGGAAADGWYAYEPLTNEVYTPGLGQSVWTVGVFLAATAMIILSACVLWTILRLRAPGMTPMRMPIFSWSMTVTCMMVVGSFPALLAAMALMAIGRVDPSFFATDVWVIGYQNLFWFYGHPVVYVMFFPFSGAVAEVLSTFSGRRYSAYQFTVVALLFFAAGSMSVWGHHLMTSGQISNDYYSLTTNFLAVPAGLEYFGFLATIVGGRLRYTASMLFALAFVPQFLIGGLTGIMLGSPVLNYELNGSYFVVAHFHYTLFAGSVFGLFAGLYLWWPKATGFMLNERLGKVHFVLMTIGTNATFLPMFIVGWMGMPRRVATYQASTGWGDINLAITTGAGVIALSLAVFVYNVVTSIVKRVPAPADPWGGQSLEWATTSPPPRFNFTAVPPIRSNAPLMDLKEAAVLEAEGKLPQAEEPAWGHSPGAD